MGHPEEDGTGSNPNGPLESVSLLLENTGGQHPGVEATKERVDPKPLELPGSNPMMDPRTDVRTEHWSHGEMRLAEQEIFSNAEAFMLEFQWKKMDFKKDPGPTGTMKRCFLYEEDSPSRHWWFAEE